MCSTKITISHTPISIQRLYMSLSSQSAICPMWDSQLAGYQLKELKLHVIAINFAKNVGPTSYVVYLSGEGWWIIIAAIVFVRLSLVRLLNSVAVPLLTSFVKACKSSTTTLLLYFTPQSIRPIYTWATWQHKKMPLSYYMGCRLSCRISKYRL